MQNQRFVNWSFEHYLRVAPPEFATPAPPRVSARPSLARAA
jgi:hypothetical protein